MLEYKKRITGPMKDNENTQDVDGSGSSGCSTDHSGRFRLAIVMPNGYGFDMSWNDRKSLEEVLRLVVVCMDEGDGIDNVIKTVVDKISEAASP